jgi:hypothetical protein
MLSLGSLFVRPLPLPVASSVLGSYEAGQQDIDAESERHPNEDTKILWRRRLGGVRFTGAVAMPLHYYQTRIDEAVTRLGYNSTEQSDIH